MADIGTYIDVLAESLDDLPQKDHEFANSLIHQYQKKGSLSEKQMWWVQKLVERATVPAESLLATIPGHAAIFVMFATAKASKLKSPAITFEHDIHLKLQMAGPNSKNAGDIYLYSEGDWVGRLSKTGQVHPAQRGHQMAGAITALLTELAADTFNFVKAYGHKSGRCCFCASPLTDEKSLTAGFGPVCAKKWGLLWGK